MEIRIEKFSASGNTFYLLDNRQIKFNGKLGELAKTLCTAKAKGVSDGLLVLEQPEKSAVKMRIFNPDGSEPEMCGNGARATAFYLAQAAKKLVKIETIAGTIEAKVLRDSVKIKLTSPDTIKLNMPLDVCDRKIHVSFINTGVPHVVVFVNAIKVIDVATIGKAIRGDAKFAPLGTNVNFVEISGIDSLKVRTYERGVEAETLACGTGIVASALVSFRLSFIRKKKIKVRSASGEILVVEFAYEDGRFSNIWLEGRVEKLSQKEFVV